MAYFSLPIENCNCNVQPCLSVLADRKLAQLRPEQAVIEAAKESPTSLFVLKVANAAIKDARYRRSGAARMFIRHIAQGKSTDSIPHWDYPVLGLINVFAAIYQAESEVQDAGIIQEMNEAYPMIIDAIYKDFRYLTGTGSVADNERTVASKLISCFAQDPDMKRTMYDEKTLKILIHCWLNTPFNHPSRIDTIMPIELFFHPIGRGPGWEPVPNYMTIAFKSFKISTFVSQANFVLKNKKLLGSPLEDEINAIGLFMRIKEPVFKPLIENKIHKQVALALMRQLKHPESGGTEGVLQEGGVFMQRILMKADDTMAMLTDLLANTCFAEVGVAAFKISSRTGSTTAATWFEIFERIKHSMMCEDTTGCPYHITPAFVQATRASLERLAIQTLMALEDHADTSRKYITLWRELLGLLQITPQSIRERYRLDKKCCNLECPARKASVRREKKHVCGECQSVWYCDSLCQKSDWKIHKTECKKMAAESWEDI